jgi:hypothetical protein
MSRIATRTIIRGNIMGCCSGKNCDRPKEDLTSPGALLAMLEESSWAVTKLLEIAKNGIRFVGFKNERINELAATISAIVTENNYLKSLLTSTKPSTVTTADDGATLFFGPHNEYRLFIATPTAEARHKLAANLIAAGKELQHKKPPAPNPQQQVFPFDV